MKRKKMTVLACVIVFCFGALILPAQNALKMVFDHDLNRVDESTFDTLVKDVHSVLGKYGFPYAIDVFKSDNKHAQKVYSLRGYSDVDKINAFFDRLPSQMGERQFQSLFVERTLAAKCDASAFFVQRNDLSFGDAGKISYSGKVAQRYYYTDAKRAAEVEKQIKTMAALYKSSGVEGGFNVAVSDLGTGQPIYLISQSSDIAVQSYRKQKGAASLKSMNRNSLVKLMTIENNLLKLSNKYEERQGYWSKELAFKPR